jgi:hypothetical protein
VANGGSSLIHYHGVFQAQYRCEAGPSRIGQRSSIQLLVSLIARKEGFMFCSDSPACCQLRQKTVQERRKDGGEDQSQDPNGFGVYLWRAGNDHEAGKSDNSRHGTHRDSNKHADDNLLHVIPLHLATFQKGPERLALILLHTKVDFSTKKDSFTRLFIPGVQISIDSKSGWT